MTLDELQGRLFLTVAEVAEVLRTDPRTIRRGIEEEAIPGRRIGGVIRIPTQAFLAWAQLAPPDVSAAGDSTSPASAQDPLDTTEETSNHGANDTPEQPSNLRRLHG